MDTFWIWLIAGAILIGSALAAEVIHADSEAEALEIMMERLIVELRLRERRNAQNKR